MDIIRITVKTVGPTMSTYGPGAFLRIMLALLESDMSKRVAMQKVMSVMNLCKRNMLSNAYKLPPPEENGLTLRHSIEDECNRHRKKNNSI